MKLTYDKNDLLDIFQNHHRFTGSPIKIGYTTLDVLDLEITEGGVTLTIGDKDEGDVTETE